MQIETPFGRIVAATLVLVFAGIVLVAAVSIVNAGTNGRLHVDRVDMTSPDSWRLRTGLRWENERTLTRGVTYNNLRVNPIAFRYGVSRRLEFGGRLTYTSNTSVNDNFADESGIEGADLFSKLRWNRNLATAFTLGYGLDKDLFPYGGDGLQIGINFPLAFALGPGTTIVEGGFTINNGTTGTAAGSVEWNDYFNYGVGYYYELTDKLRLTTEVVGQGPSVDLPSAKDHLEVVITPELLLNEVSALKPSLGFGLDDGSPDFSFGLEFTYKIGETGHRRVRINERDIASGDFDTIEGQQSTVEMPDQNRPGERTEPLVLPGELQPDPESDTPGTKQNEEESPERNPARAQELANQGREAFERDGNLTGAIRLFKRAVKYDSRNVEILSNLGSLLYRKGQYKQASQYYRQALTMDPNDQFSHLFLGITLLKQDKIDPARNHLERAQSIDPDNSTARRAQRWLDKIEENDE